MAGEAALRLGPITDTMKPMAHDPPGSCDLVGLAPADAFDPVLEEYKKGVDRTLLRENLKLTPQERSEQLVKFLAAIGELRAAEERLRGVGP
jgi:hypothetical protein